MAGWKPKRSESAGFDANPNGIATVKLLKNKRLGILFSEGGEFAGKKYKVSEWPEHINPKLLPGAEWYIKLNGKGDEIFAISPQDGFFQVKVQKFVSKEGEPPAPRYMKNWQYPDWVFYVLLEVVSGLEAAVGMTIIYQLPYRFEEGEDGLAQYSKWNEKSNTLKLDEFLEYADAWKSDQPLMFSDNLLPLLQKRVLKAGNTFGVFLKGGYVDYVTAGSKNEVEEVGDDWEEDDPPFEEEKPKKKKKKKAKEVPEETNDDEEVDFEWDSQ